jgi:hypothetical protein
MKYFVHNQPVSGLAAEAHFIEWCLSLENENKPVPRCSLDAIAFFQTAREKQSVLKLAGIEIQ